MPTTFFRALTESPMGRVWISMLVHWRYREQHPGVDREDFALMREYFADMFGEAVARKNSTVFREVAEILETLPEGDYEHVNRDAVAAANSGYDVVRFVIQARIFLEAQMIMKRAPRRELTKSEVKQLAQHLWAGNRLVARSQLHGPSKETSKEAEDLIQAEMQKFFPTVDWTKVWKKAGCADLKNLRLAAHQRKRRKVKRLFTIPLPVPSKKLSTVKLSTGGQLITS